MLVSRRQTPLACLGILLLCILDFSIAHSQRRNRIVYISTVSKPTIRTPSHRAHAHSSFDLEFSLHDGTQDVKLTLEPNNDVIPEGAVVVYMDEDGAEERREPLLKSEYKVYKGNSWLRDDRGWTWAGWARIMVLRDGEEPLFEGAFSLNHDAHHIHLRENYMKTRHELDPVPQEDGDEAMVVFRDSDMETDFWVQGGVAGRAAISDDVMCPSDRLEFNVQPGNAINKMITEAPRGVLGSLGLDKLLGGGQVGGLARRQSTVDTGILGGSGNSAGVNLQSTIGSTDGCPQTRQVALMGVATDCTYTGDFSSEQNARLNVINQINSASNLYEQTFNITLGLSQLVVSKASCPGTPPDSAKWNIPCSKNTTIENRLNLFSQWRGEKANDTLALWTLLTTCETGASVGLAWLGQLCQGQATTDSQDGSFVSGANVVARTPTEWKVIAHEIGHTMGAVHDCTSDTCQGNSASASMCCPLSKTTCDAGGQFIMNPSTSDQIQKFSPCTVGNICSAFKRRSVDTSCLTSNKGVTVLTQKECGNGIVEEGEDCDCGGEAGCAQNQCCDAKTCKFTSGSVCDESNEDCCRNCQFAAAGTVCRPSTGDCDPKETCSGNNATCPTDVVAKDGTGCSNGLKCASGQCTSRDQQCQSVMGQISSSSNDTRSCDSSSCIITCQSPALGTDVCLRMQQNFLDGTPCEGDGVCKNGQCSGGSALGAVKNWIDSHKAIVIGVASAVGGLLLLSILSCCVSRCRRRSVSKNLPPYAVPPPGWQRGQQNYMQQPQMAHMHGGRGGFGASPYQQQGPVRYA